MRSIKYSLINALVLGIPITSFAQKAETPPNILIIMADDLDSRQISCYGGQNIKTPNIDALAKRGLKFGNLFCSEAMCVPIRASLFTGLYPARHGSFQNHKKVYPETEAIGKYLADLGYTVALTGKDHSTKPESIFRFKMIPGFENNCVAPTANYTVDSIKEFMTNNIKPFCLFVMSTNPHAPWTVGDPSAFDPQKLVLPQHWVDTREGRTEFCKYLAEVRALDNQVGDVVSALKSTGKENNTLILFLGEQGPQMPGGKWTLYDYGIKSAMIAVLPGITPKGTISKAMVQYEDITPTLIEIADGKPIAKLDGKSFLSVIKGNTDIHRDYVYGIHNNIPEGTAYPIRSIRDSKYKLVANLMFGSTYYLKWTMNPLKLSIIWGSWLQASKNSKNAKTMVDRILKHPEYELYDTENDPYELNNLIEKPELKKVVDDLKENLDEWMNQQKDPGKALDDAALRKKAGR